MLTQLQWDSAHQLLKLGGNTNVASALLCICTYLAQIKFLFQARNLLYKFLYELRPKNGSLTPKKNESIVLASKSLNFPSLPMEPASLFCEEYSLFSTNLPPTKPTCSDWSPQLDFKLQEFPAQDLFFYMMLSLKRNHFSRIYKCCHWPQWKQNKYLPECSMKGFKEQGQGGWRKWGPG